MTNFRSAPVKTTGSSSVPILQIKKISGKNCETGVSLCDTLKPCYDNGTLDCKDEPLDATYICNCKKDPDNNKDWYIGKHCEVMSCSLILLVVQRNCNPLKFEYSTEDY